MEQQPSTTSADNASPKRPIEAAELGSLPGPGDDQHSKRVCCQLHTASSSLSDDLWEMADSRDLEARTAGHPEAQPSTVSHVPTDALMAKEVIDLSSDDDDAMEGGIGSIDSQGLVECPNSFGGERHVPGCRDCKWCRAVREHGLKTRREALRLAKKADSIPALLPVRVVGRTADEILEGPVTSIEVQQSSDNCRSRHLGSPTTKQLYLCCIGHCSSCESSIRERLQWRMCSHCVHHRQTVERVYHSAPVPKRVRKPLQPRVHKRGGARRR